MNEPSPELLALLRCPLTMQPLRLAIAEDLARIAPPLEAALIREDGTVLYPIRDGIPLLLAEEAITIDGTAEAGVGVTLPPSRERADHEPG